MDDVVASYFVNKIPFSNYQMEKALETTQKEESFYVFDFHMNVTLLA